MYPSVCVEAIEKLGIENFKHNHLFKFNIFILYFYIADYFRQKGL